MVTILLKIEMLFNLLFIYNTQYISFCVMKVGVTVHNIV